MSRVLSESERIDLNPMMDVIFILLIFFIVTTSFVKESGIAIQRSTQSTEPLTTATTAIIRLDSTSVRINQQLLSVDGLASRLTQMRSTNPDLKVQLVADKAVPVERLVHAMDQIKTAGMEDVAIAAYTDRR